MPTEIREALATRVEVSEGTLSVELADGRTIAGPWPGIPAWHMLRPRSGLRGG